jgi:hypothetical protein
MVAINSIPQQEVAKGSGHKELARAIPTTLSIRVAKNPGPSIPGGASALRSIFDFSFVLIYLSFKAGLTAAKINFNLI